MFATGLCFASIVSTVSSLFEGQSIAILPFEPVFFFKSLAQRGLTLAKPNDCSFFFLVSFCCLRAINFYSIYVKYILSTMALRQPLQKLLGFAPSRSASKLSNIAFQPPQDTTQSFGRGNY